MGWTGGNSSTVDIHPTKQHRCWLEIATLSSVVQCIAVSTKALLISGHLRSEFPPLSFSPFWDLYLKASELHAYPFTLCFGNIWTIVISSELFVKEPITIQMNKEIIEKNESGACVTDIARELIKAVSTIGTIVKTKEKIKVLKMANGVTLIVFKKRPQIIN